jgi:hypothetical protein
VPPEASSDSALFRVLTSVTRVEGLVVDCLANDASSDGLTLFAASGNSSVEGEGVRVLLTEDQAAKIQPLSKTDTDHVVLRGVVTDHDLAPATVNGSQPVYEYLSLQTQRSSEGIVQPGVDGIAVSIARTLRDVSVTLVGESVTFPGLLPGRLGQCLTVSNAGTGTVTVHQGGATLIGAPEDLTLVRHQSVRFVFDGTEWVTLS